MLITPFTKLTLKMVGLIVAMVVACRLTQDIAMGVIALIGMFFASMNQRGKALIIYLIFPFLGIFNPLVLPHAGLYSMMARLGTLGMTVALMFAATRSSGRQKIPLGGLYLFMVCALISSAQGWFPMISYLKIINFLVFISGVYIGTRNLHHRPDDILLLRSVFFALSIILVFGSIATLPFPAVAYVTSLGYYIREGGVAYAESMFESNQAANMSLFAGITNHSQFLAPLLVCINGWVLCDMLLIEKKVEKFHLALLALIPFLIYMTRSRVGFIGYFVSVGLAYFYVLPRSAAAGHLRGRLSGAMAVLLLLLIAGAAASEFENQSMSRWLRKTDNLVEDSRSFTEALTNSRQGGLELCLYEFWRSPLLGSGFQVIEAQREMYAKGEITLFSAPIEKGLLPLMVLGETGLLGMAAFGVFLLLFVSGCVKNKYHATLMLFGCLFITNIGEATFFAPSGGGGVLWMVTIVGGFLIDMTLFLERNRVNMLALFQENGGAPRRMAVRR